MYMIDPKNKMGGMVDITYGSFNATRGFLRFDTGRIGATNLRAYFSYSQGRQDHWRGPGWDNKKHGEMKIVNDWGDGNRVSLAVVGNNIQNNAYPNVTKASWDKWGTGITNPVGSSGLSPTDPPNTVYESNYYVPAKAGSVNYYKTRPNPFTNIYASMPSTFKLNDHLVLTETPYSGTVTAMVAARSIQTCPNSFMASRPLPERSMALARACRCSIIRRSPKPIARVPRPS